MTIDLPDPFDTLLRLQRALDTPRPDSRFGFSTAGGGAFPPVNVFQKGHDFVVVAELPGMEKDALTVEVQRNHMRLAGRRLTTAREGVSHHRRERAVGDFDRTLTFPIPLDSGSATARFEDGLLTVTLPPAAEVKPRAVTIG